MCGQGPSGAGVDVVGFEFGHQGDKLVCAKGENWAFLLSLRNCKATRGQNMWLTAVRSMLGHPRECLSTCLRHLPTAGVCDPYLSMSLRHLPTAGVCDQHLGIFPRYLFIAGPCLHEFGMSSRHCSL